MPVKTSSNSKILPANARAVDVAKRAIQEILPVQQMRYQDAFRVQGYEGVLYNRLNQGLKCTCKSSQKHLATRLDESGKASPTTINELMTGAVFNVSAYGRGEPQRPLDPFNSVVSPDAPVSKYQGVFDNVSTYPDALPTRVVDKGFGDNGPADIEIDLDAIANDFDTTAVGYNEVACAVCFGSGFVGGYSPLYGRRIVKACDQVELRSTDTIDPMYLPWRCTSEGFKFTEVLPYGAVALDAFRVMFDHRPVTANFTIDGQAVNEISVLRFCDGRPHLIEVQFKEPTQFTHVELQFKTSKDDAFFEFPKLNKSSATEMLDTTDPFQIILSPMVPAVQVEDVFTDSTFGRALIVQSVNEWNTRTRQVLGWEVQVRVLQSTELYNALPRRGRIQTKPQTSNMVHDNSTGHRRT
jgi:hypothetical protein